MKEAAGVSSPRPYDAAVILAGGESRRMLSEKALLEAGGRTLVERAAALFAPRVRRILVSVGRRGPSSGLASALDRAARDAGVPVNAVADEHDAAGPLAGAAAALTALEGRAARTFVLAVDMPDVPWLVLEALWERAAEAGARGCVPQWACGLEPACGVYAVGLSADARRLLEAGERSLTALARAPGVRSLDLERPEVAQKLLGGAPPDWAAIFRSLNTPEDYRAWLAAQEGR